MMDEMEPTVIYRPIQKCSNCGKIIENPNTKKCIYCGALFANHPMMHGVVVDNTEWDMYPKLRLGMDKTAKAVEELSERLSNIKNGEGSNYQYFDMKNIPSRSDLLKVVNRVANDLGKEVWEISESEYRKFRRAIRVITNSAPRHHAEIYSRRIPKTALGLASSKVQFNKEFDGTQPMPGKFGISRIRPQFFGMKSWVRKLGDECAFWEIEDNRRHWIHSGVEPLNGTVGNAVRFGENIMMVLLGFTDLLAHTGHENSSITCLQLEMDGKIYPKIDTSSFLDNPYPIMEFENAVLIYKDTTLRAEVTMDTSRAESAPAFIGYAFLPEPQMRTDDLTYGIEGVVRTT